MGKSLGMLKLELEVEKAIDEIIVVPSVEHTWLLVEPFVLKESTTVPEKSEGSTNCYDDLRFQSKLRFLLLQLVSMYSYNSLQEQLCKKNYFLIFSI